MVTNKVPAFGSQFSSAALWGHESQGGGLWGEAVGSQGHDHPSPNGHSLQIEPTRFCGDNEVSRGGDRISLPVSLQVLFVLRLRGRPKQWPCSSLIQMDFVHVSGERSGTPAEVTKPSLAEPRSRNSRASGLSGVKDQGGDAGRKGLSGRAWPSVPAAGACS